MVEVLQRLDTRGEAGDPGEGPRDREGGSPGCAPEVLMVGGGEGRAPPRMRVKCGYDDMALVARVKAFQRRSWAHRVVSHNFLMMADPQLDKGDPKLHKTSTLKSLIRHSDYLEGYIESLNSEEPADRRDQEEEFLARWPTDTHASDYLSKVPWEIADAVMHRVERDRPVPRGACSPTRSPA